MPGALRSIGFVHLGRPESGVRRYGQIVAGAIRERGGVMTYETEAGRVDDGSTALAEVAADLSEAQVAIVQWNRRGWGRASLARFRRFRRSYRGALVVTLHDIFERHGVRERWLQPEAWTLRYLARAADRVVVHSQVEVERLAGLIPAERIAVIPHFVERRTLPLAPAEARAKLGLADRRIVTLLGFVYGRKGHRQAVDAVPHLPDDVVMVYAGGPVAGRPFVHDLALSKAASLGLGDRFRITGYLGEDELETWMAATHLAILPFTDLSASGSLSTWIAAGKPILVSDLPGFREYDARVPGALRFFGPVEPAPIAAAIRAALEGPLPDPDPAVQALAQDLSLERTAERYLTVAQEALASRG